jgi:hypothetical protein
MTKRRRRSTLSPGEWRQVAIHEAGHVIANFHFGIPLVDVVINADVSGCVNALDTPEPRNLLEAEPFKIARYAGIAADQVMLGLQSTNRDSEDYRTVWTFVRPLFRKDYRFESAVINGRSLSPKH